MSPATDIDDGVNGGKVIDVQDIQGEPSAHQGVVQRGVFFMAVQIREEGQAKRALKGALSTNYCLIEFTKGTPHQGRAVENGQRLQRVGVI
jgi:hypothetical protein